MELLVAVVLAPFVVALLVAGLRQPLRVALPAYAFFLPYGSGLPAGLPSAFGSASSLVGVVLAVGLLVQLTTTRRGTPRLTAAVPVWLMFLGIAGASAFWSIAPQVTVRSFAVLAGLTILYALLAVSRIDRAALLRTENALILGAVVAVLYGLAQLLLLGGLPTDDQGSPRFGNGLLGPNNQAAALLLPLAIALARTAARPRVLDRLAHAVLAGLMLVGIIMTGSRGGLLAAAVTAALVVMLTPRGRGALMGFGAVAAAMLALVLLVNPAGVGERQTNQTDSSGRAEIWRVGIHACQSVCLTGSGWGTFPRLYAQERASVPDVRVLRRGTAFEPHNIWLLAAVEAGFVGLVLLSAGLFLTLVDALRLPVGVRGPPIAALAGTLAAGFFLSNLEFKFFWMMLAYVALVANCTDTPSGSVVEPDARYRAGAGERTSA